MQNTEAEYKITGGCTMMMMMISVCSWFRATIWRATAGGLSRCLDQRFGTVCQKTLTFVKFKTLLKTHFFKLAYYQ